ncbi:MAG: hypothetical protein JNK02_18075 [Planctomycetes bacterium]|nr:hypothetical protein [Planctomycetota bacterium]
MRDSNLAAAQPWLLGVFVPGYAPVRLRSSDLPLDPGAPTRVIELTPAVPRSLRLVHADGRPFRRPAAVRSPRGDVLLTVSRGSPDGVLGPLGWLGGDLLIRPGWDGPFSQRVPATALEAQELVEVVVAEATGSVVIEGVPGGADPADFIVKLELGPTWAFYEPTRIEPTRWTFEGIPSGTSLVGPRSWVEGAEFHTFGVPDDSLGIVPRECRLRVTPGATTTIPWQPVWLTETPLEGRVTCVSPVPFEWFVSPVYVADGSPGIPRVAPSRAGSVVPVARDGSYRIAAEDPLPDLLLVLGVHEGRWGDRRSLHVLESLLPGESAALTLGSVELVDRGGPRTQVVRVAVEIPESSYRHPITTMTRKIEALWPPGVPCRIDGIPVHVRELTLRWPGGVTRVVSIALRADVPVVLDVDPTSGRPADKGG